MSVEVKQLLERDYNTVLNVPEIRGLTIAQLLAIGQNSEEAVPESANQSEYLKFEIPEESLTLLNDITEGKPVLLLPPIDGSFRLLMQLSEMINRPVIALHWSEDCLKYTTIEGAVKYYLDIIESKLKDRFGDEYDIIGYCFGGSIGYEMAIHFEVCLKENHMLSMNSA